jgi:DNA-binding MarR family transcriptional regulator
MKNGYMVLIGFLIFSTSVYSQSYPRIEQALKDQKASIQAGVNRGDLSRSELAKLVKGRKYIESLIKKGRADNNFTGKERKAVLSILNKRRINITRLLKNSTRSGKKESLQDYPRIVKAFNNQRTIVKRGTDRGDLSKYEVKVLVREGKHIRLLVERGLADKNFTAKERNQVLSLLKKRRMNITKLSENSVREPISAGAQRASPFLNKMEKGIRSQNSRILKAKDQRKLSKKEFQKLKRSLSRLRTHIRNSLKDGVFSHKEKNQAQSIFLKRSSLIVRFTKN